MRKISGFIVFITSIVMFITSCDKELDINPQGVVSESTLNNQTGMDLICINAYGYLTQSYRGGGIDNWAFGSIMAGDANKGTTAADGPADLIQIEYLSILSNNAWTLEKWNFNYRLIKAANQAINSIRKVEGVDAAYKAKREGEMRFLRAYAYFELRRFFKWVPYVDEVLEAAEIDPKVNNNTDIYPKIEADLTAAIEMLPEVQDNIGRVNKWAAVSLLGKVYLYQNKHPLAATELKKVIDNGVNSKGIKYNLVEKYGDVFEMLKENTSETVFDIQYSSDNSNNADYPMTGNQPYMEPILGGWGLFQPSYNLVNSFQVDEDGLPRLDGSYMDNVIPGTESLTRNHTTDVADKTIPVDPRLDHTVGRTGVPFYDWGLPKANWVRERPNGGAFHPKKNIWRKSDGFYMSLRSAKNYHVIRYSDVLLMYAEALAETGQHAQSRDWVNLVRARAANDKVLYMDGTPAANYQVGLYPESFFATKEDALKAIRFERKLEFGMEGIRFFDLQRWGFPIAKSEIDFYLTEEKAFLGKFAGIPLWEEYKMIFPIPNDQILTMGKDESGEYYLKQNPGY